MIANHSGAEIIAELLVDLAILVRPAQRAVWPIFIAYMPHGKGAELNCAVATDLQGTPDGRISRTGEVIEHPAFQIKVRGKDYPTGYQKAREIAVALSGIRNNIVTMADTTQYRFWNVSQGTNILAMGQDRAGTSKAFYFSINFTMTITEVT